MIDPLYIGARKVLLTALEALDSHREAFVVVGAQAIYLHTGEADFGVAPYTTDADLAIEPARLENEPTIGAALTSAGFILSDQPGIWEVTANLQGTSSIVQVDLLVPSAFAPAEGRRGARLGIHGQTTTRKVMGLEPCLLDNDFMKINSLDAADERSVLAKVAGPTALLIAKVHKLRDRVAGGKTSRIDEKDAGDAYRLMLTTNPDEFASVAAKLMENDQIRPSVSEGMNALLDLFGRSMSRGVRMAVQSLRIGVPEERVVEICVTFVKEATR